MGLSQRLSVSSKSRLQNCPESAGSSPCCSGAYVCSLTATRHRDRNNEERIFARLNCYRSQSTHNPDMSQTAHFSIKEHKVPACHIREYAGSTASSQEDVLYLSVKQHKPIKAVLQSEKPAITIIATPGVGLPKVHLLLGFSREGIAHPT